MYQAIKKHLDLLPGLLLLSLTVTGQAKSGLENYNFLGRGQQYAWMPVFHYETTDGLYAEFRYNYEALNTFSMYGGKSFSGGRKLQFVITPMLGFSAGDFTGISVAANTEAEWSALYFSCQSQYSIATSPENADFLFNWAELGYMAGAHFFGGLAMQYTVEQSSYELDPGVVGGVNFRNISIPLYVFKPFSKGRFFILGINFQYNIKKNRKDKDSKSS